MPDKQKPVHEVRVGSVKAAIWENPTENGVRHNVTFERLYKSDDCISSANVRHLVG